MKAIAISIRHYLPLLAVALIFLICYALTLSSISVNHPELFVGIIYDLTLTSPLIYLVLAWKTKLPKITAIPITILGYILARLIIPEGYEEHLGYIELYLLPVLEIGVIGFIIYNTRKVIRSYRMNNTGGGDFYQILKVSSAEVLGNRTIGNLFATEISMISYALLIWRKRDLLSNQFTAYKTSGAPAIYIALTFVLIAETIGLHILLMRWNETIAWIIFTISIYAGLQILGHLKAITKRYTEVGSDELVLKYGLAGDARINYNMIKSIQAFDADLSGRDVQKLALLGKLENHNILIELHTSAHVEKLYGFKKEFNQILFYIDEPKSFIETINHKLNDKE